MHFIPTKRESFKIKILNKTNMCKNSVKEIHSCTELYFAGQSRRLSCFSTTVKLNCNISQVMFVISIRIKIAKSIRRSRSTKTFATIYRKSLMNTFKRTTFRVDS